MAEQPAVAFLSHLASPAAATGAERCVAAWARHLAARGWRVLVVVPGPWSLTSEVEAAGVSVRFVAARPCWLTYWDSRPWPIVLAKWVRYAWPSLASRKLRQAVTEFDADLVHVNCLPHLRGAAAAQTLGLPRIWHLHEILPPGVRRRWFAERLRRFDGPLLAVSEAVAAWVRDEGLASRVQVVHNGVEIPPLAPDPRAARNALQLPDDGIVVAFAGQLHAHKGAGVLVAAADRAMLDAPSLRVAIAGGGPRRAVTLLREQIAQTKHPDRFHLLGALPSAAPLLAAADIVCVPTLTPDPFPLSVLEGMAQGRAVVGSAAGGILEMIDDRGGLLVRPGDVSALTRALVDLAHDACRRDAFAAAARARAAAEFNMDRHLETMEAVLRESWERQRGR